LEDEMGKACSTIGVIRKTYKIVIRKPQGKIPLGKPVCKYDNIKIDLK
jgi:hypothetical protein